MAVFDFTVAAAAMVLVFTIAWYFHFRQLAYCPFLVSSLLLTLPVAIVAHVVFGVPTSVNALLGLSGTPTEKN